MRRTIYLALAAAAVLAVLTGAFVWPAQGRNSSIGVVNMEKVIAEYMAQPLLKARDELQAKFDQERAGLEDEAEISALFQDYQVQLSKLEARFRTDIQKAIAAVGARHGFEVIIPAAGVLYGGVDVTDEVLAALTQ